MRGRLFLLLSLGFFSTTQAHAQAWLDCQDSSGQSLFSGFFTSERVEKYGSFKHEQNISYKSLVSSTALGATDRRTLREKHGIDPKKCQGPYVGIFERVEAPGKLRCASGSVKPDESSESEFAMLKAFGLAEKEAECAVILPREKIRAMQIFRDDGRR